MTSSLQEISFIGSALDKDQRRRFQQRLDALDEHGRIPAVDDAMIQLDDRFIILRGTNWLPSHIGRTIILLTPTIATSGWLITGVVATPPIAPSDVMVMVEPVSSSRVALPLRAASLQPNDLGGAVPDVAGLGMPHHGDDKAGRRLHVAMPTCTPACRWMTFRLVVEQRVHARLFGDRLDHSPHQERDQRQLGPIGALLLVERGAQLLQRGDVHFLDIGDVGNTRDFASAIFSAILRRSLTTLMSSTPVARRARRFCRLRSARQEGIQILMADATGRSAARDLPQIDAGLPGAQAHGRRNRRPLASGARRRSGGRTARLLTGAASTPPLTLPQGGGGSVRRVSLGFVARAAAALAARCSVALCHL